MIARYGVGLDNVDVVAAEEAGIAVVNVPDYCVEEVAAVHRAFLEAGADCVITASYQASHAGFARLGLDDEKTDELLIRSVTLARDAVDEFWAEADGRGGRLRPIVAASVGPYGAYLADGSEYDGR